MRKEIIISAIGFLIFSCSTQTDKQAPLFDNLGTLHFSVTTDSEQAQKYFNQGLILAYGFNHEEAFRSFEEAARLDTNCAMAYWGMAYVLGPNINLPMDAGVVTTAYDAILKAISLLDKETQREHIRKRKLLHSYKKQILQSFKDCAKCI